MSYGGRSDAGFIGENCPFDADYENSQEAPESGFETERALENQSKGSRDGSIVHAEDYNTRKQVDPAHGRHDLGGNLGDALDPSENNEAYENRHGQSVCPWEFFQDGEHGFDQVQGLTDLKGVAPAKGTSYAKYAEQARQEASEVLEIKLLHTFGKVMHGTPHDFPVGPDLAVFLPEEAFGELGGHAEKADENHPEGSARAARPDGNGYPGYVAKPHGCRKRGREGLKVRDFPFAVLGIVFSPHKVDGMFK